MKEFRVLLVYANSPMDNLIPLNISYLTACLKKKGIYVRLFDTTFYKTTEKSSDEARVEMLQVKPFSLSKYEIKYKISDIFEDFRKLVIEYKPQLIGFSVVEPTYKLAERLLDSIREIKGESKVIFGGIFAIFAHKTIIRHALVDMVCYGEGEEIIVEVCEKISKRESVRDVKNLAIKENGQIYYSKNANLIDLNQLPYLDFSLFEKERFYKPMGGKVLRMVPLEFSRGCPYRCTYCASPALIDNFNKYGKWYRQKDIKRIINEIEFYLKEYKVEYFYFISESFLNMDRKKFGEFIDYYKEIKVPFWFNTRIETITADKLKKLESINCDRISIGLESGSEYIRNKLLQRNYSNEDFIKKFKILNDYNISISVNNIIGFPGETREQIFETINLNRKLKADSFGAYIFQPYCGTRLRDYCVKKGYISEDYISGDAHYASELNMPQLTKEEISGLQKTFNLYVRLPQDYYPEIKIAEQLNEEGNCAYERLSKIYHERYFK